MKNIKFFLSWLTLIIYLVVVFVVDGADVRTSPSTAPHHWAASFTCIPLTSRGRRRRMMTLWTRWVSLA